MTDRSLGSEMNEVLIAIHGDVIHLTAPEAFTEAFWNILESECKSAQLLGLVRDLQLRRDDIDRDTILAKAEKHGLTGLHVEELATISTDEELCEAVLTQIYPEILTHQDTPTDEKSNASIPSTHLPSDRQSVDAGLAMALSDNGATQTACRWNLSVQRKEATVDIEECPQPDETASIRVLWTSVKTLQIGLSGFLSPIADQRVQIIWMSNEGAVLAQSELPTCEDTIVTLQPTPRQPVIGDRLQARMLDQGRLFLEVDITPTDWK